MSQPVAHGHAYLEEAFEIQHRKDNHPQGTAPHQHGSYEMVYIIKGTLTCDVESTTHHLAPGDLMLVPPNRSHRIILQPEQAACDRITLYLTQSFMDHFALLEPPNGLAACFNRAASNSVLHLQPAQRQRVAELLSRLLEERTIGGFATQLALTGLLTELLVEANRISIQNASRKTSEERSATLAMDLKQYINDHYAEPLSLDGLAERFFVSKYHLLHDFNHNTGTSVYHYIIQRRLEVARQLLLEGTAPNDVYQQCGFGDYANFYRAFRSAYGVSPRTYAENLRRLSASGGEGNKP